MLTGNYLFLSLGGTVITIVLPTQIHFFEVIAYYMTVQVMWKVPAWGLTFRLPQQTVIIQIANQGAFTKCSSFQIGRVIVTVEFTPF